MSHPPLPTGLLAEIDRRRGRPPVLPPLAGRQTALLVVDMQTAFVKPGAALETPAARGIVEPINTLARTLRNKGGRVVWIYTTLPAADSDRAWNYLQRFVRPEQRQQVFDALQPGNEGHAIWPELESAPQDLICEKDRFSPFSPGASDLDSQLRQAGITTLLIAGTVTNVCCESTARDAMMLNYDVIMIEDANAADTDADHHHALRTIAEVFGRVATTQAVTTALRPA